MSFLASMVFNVPISQKILIKKEQQDDSAVSNYFSFASKNSQKILIKKEQQDFRASISSSSTKSSPLKKS